ncbi:MAG: hypothetical protein H3C30_10635 [Candidatus Hydrogenedentes bacterium]|nr:hypothetical protein [Candidatus Hydrogenedentota bacterium]
MNPLLEADGEFGAHSMGRVNHPTREEQRALVRQWEETGRELDRIRREALRGMPYNWKDVAALLSLGDAWQRPPRTESGLVEMQYWFMRGRVRCEEEMKGTTEA